MRPLQATDQTEPLAIGRTAGPGARPQKAGVVSVIVPCYNEGATLTELVARLGLELPRLGRPFETILVNDGSRDRTADIARRLAADRPWLKVINLCRNSGQTAALMAGFNAARGAVVVALDGDLQNDPSDIPRLLQRLDEGFDVVSGWRTRRRDHAIRRVLFSRVANAVISAVTGVRLHDFGCTLKAYRREVLEGVNLYGEMHRFIPVYASWNGARITEVQVRHEARAAGRSNYGLSRVVKVFLDLLVVLFLHRYSQKPIYVFGVCGLASFAVSAAAAGAMVYYKVWGGKSFIETPLPLVWSTMFFTGVLCLLLGLVAEVAMRIYHESSGRRTYRIASTVNLADAQVQACCDGG
jgi:glycosyltransferase involved in cell wall biosynthesis